MAMLRVAQAAAVVVTIWCVALSYQFEPLGDNYDENGPIPIDPAPWPAAHPVESGLIAGAVVLVLGAIVVATRSD